MTEAALPDDIQARVFRDGMIAFKLGPSGPSYLKEFEAWNESLLLLMNAHLACLRAALGVPFVFRSAVVSTWTTAQVEFGSGRWMAASEANGPMAGLLSQARNTELGPFDWRLDRGPLIAVPTEMMEDSFALLSHLLVGPSRDLNLSRAGLLHRATVSLGDLDSVGALTSAWTVIEGLLGTLLRRYLDENADRPVPGDSKFINSKRREFFESAQVTFRHIAEILSLADVLPFPLYETVCRCGKARNDWLHHEKAPSHEIAGSAIASAGELFEQVEGIPLRLI